MTDIDEESLSVVPLHQHIQFMKQCCNLVNEEWPRSETARLLSLKTSCDKMPTCLILVTKDNRVIGHCKLTPIPSIPTSCFIESMVISKSVRGKGLGTFLMRACEEYCRRVLLLSTIHLSTKGQEYFYEKLGYAVCEPITIYGSFPMAKNNSVFLQNSSVIPLVINSQLKSSIPPPPPPPLKNNGDKLSEKQVKTYMVKSIQL